VTRRPPSRRLIAVLALLALTSVLVFGWIAWRFHQEAQRSQTALIDRLTEAGLLIAREVGSELDRWDAMAARGDTLGALPPAGTLLVFDADAVISVRGEPLAYYPALAKSEVQADDRLMKAQAAERAGDLDAAIAGYRDAATSTARTPRAIATAGLGRTLRAKGNLRESLTAYDELAQMAEARIDNQPAPLVAYRERQTIFQALGDTGASERERARIDSALRARTYLIDRPTFDAFAPALSAEPYSQPLLARADVVATRLWPRWRAIPSGRLVAGIPSQAFASIWRPSPAGSVAIVAPVGVLMERPLAVASRLSTMVALEDADGRHIWGETPPRGDTATVPLHNVGLTARLRLWISNR
jgi:hypothetical protein